MKIHSGAHCADFGLAEEVYLTGKISCRTKPPVRHGDNRLRQDNAVFPDTLHCKKIMGLFKAKPKNKEKIDYTDLTEGSITRKLLSYSWPIIAGNVMLQLYNVVDSIVVGNFAQNRTYALAAVSACGPITMIFNSLYTGVSMGAGIIISQYKGSKDPERLEKSLNTTFLLSVLMSIAITFLGLIFSRPMLELIKTPEEIIGDAALYLDIIFIGSIGNITYNIMQGLVRGLGDTKWPFFTLSLSSVVNIVLDLLFVCVFHWDVAGVAWATTISHIISATLTLLKQRTGVYGARITLKKLRLDRELTGLIVKLGMPSAIQNVAVSGAGVITQAFSNQFGADFIAANSVVNKIDGFALLPIMGFGMAVSAFVGQNIGAGKIDRVNKGVRLCGYIIVGMGVVIGVVICAFAGLFMKLFGTEGVVYEMGLNGLYIVSFFYILQGLSNIYGSAIRGAGAATAAAVISMGSTFIRIPIFYFMAILPLRNLINAAVSSGAYASYELAAAAGVGVAETYSMNFWAMSVSIVIGFIIMIAYYIWGNWRSRGITEQARAAAKEASQKA